MPEMARTLSREYAYSAEIVEASLADNRKQIGLPKSGESRAYVYTIIAFCVPINIINHRGTFKSK